MATEKKEVAAAAATNIGCNNPGSCPVILAIGAANATSLRLLGSAGAPPAPKAPAVTGPRVCTEVQKARKKGQRQRYKAKKKKRTRKTPHHGRGMGPIGVWDQLPILATTVVAEEHEDTAAPGLEDHSEDLGQEENTAPVLDSVPSGAEEEIKMGSYTVSLKPSGNDWYEMDQEDREADSQKLSKA